MKATFFLSLIAASFSAGAWESYQTQDFGNQSYTSGWDDLGDYVNIQTQTFGKDNNYGSRQQYTSGYVGDRYINCTSQTIGGQTYTNCN